MLAAKLVRNNRARQRWEFNGRQLSPEGAVEWLQIAAVDPPIEKF
jgi:hypothetical protein